MKTPLAPGATIGILGGGQLGRMLAVAAAQLGYRCHVYAPEGRAVAADVAAQRTTASFEDQDALSRFADGCDIVTYEFENVPTAPLAALMGEQGGGELKIPENQDPEGATVSIQVQVGEGPDAQVVDLPFKLFESSAPTGTSALLAKTEGGDLDDAEILQMGPFALRILLPNSKDAEALPLERSFGCFHSAGTLGTLVDPSGARSRQKGGELLIHLEDAYSYDGRTTVLGRIADPAALDILREIAGSVASGSENGPKTVKVLSARRL